MHHRRKRTWLLASGIALAVIVIGLAQLAAQRRGGPGPAQGLAPPGQAGRYTVVHVDSHEGVFRSVILLDTATGDLYKADSGDIKKYADRPKDRPLGPPPLDHDGRRPEPGRDGRERRPREEKDRARPRDRDRDRPAEKDRDRGREHGNDR